ncbi:MULTISPECIES: DUF6049 family protein [Streptomyces]|uniref:DUF6049 family protein n=1 Tax=Streptomyces mirabilis TaxID=68239 RepID=A0ABU3UQ35_9ACTN|nr:MULTISPECIES: DUF6049 family protein [Streptomyces]MCX4610286.1 DUF6049 family protein [Streptomyces mirabilis]MCX5350506.1 DUF6049 family protein [Streptomyces mirabilis]MDU8996037.1 DUF6049 family protein [Streptomyces mirabilis]QDN79141.1 hypothetical protein FNV64_29365 [Streptomyces sp. S1A1-7]QDN88890.1 hypothetical protein FNV61_27760 [Streptomyces sp. RLB3-6]
MAEAADFQGMSPSPARRWLRRTGTLLAGAPLLAGVLQLPSSPAAHAAQTAAVADATGSGTVDISLDSLTPSAPAEGDTITVSGSVTNKGKQTVTGAHVGLRVGPTLQGRVAIDDAEKRTGFQLGPDPLEVGGKYVEKFSKLATGVSQHFSISVPVKDLNLDSDGVYQLGVSLTGQTAAQPWDQVLGIKRTFLPWQPAGADTKTKTTYLWPLISAVHLRAETGSDAQQTPVFQNDDLAKEISPGGRLDQLLSLGSDLDVTWVLDPDLLASVDAMTRSYQIKNGDTTTAGKNQAVAKAWLDKLEKTVADKDKEVVALPFADPDLASLAHNGKDVTGSLSHLKDATDVASSTVQTILHVKPNTDFAWPAEGAVDPSIVKVATSAGADKVIARSDSLRETGGLTYTPTAARPIGGGTTAVVADSRLSTAFEGDMAKADNSTLAVQEFLAQSLMVDLQEPSKQRSIVVAPQRMPSVSQAQTMATAVRALQDGNWSDSQNLSAAAKAKPDPSATTNVPSASSYPSSLRKQELPRSAFEEIQRTQSTLDNFKAILTDKSRVVTPFGRAIDRGMSTSWRGRADQAETFRKGVESYLDDLTGLVRLIDKSDAKLSGRSATIPVTVQNNLVQGVHHLVLRLTSQQPTRLKIGDDTFDERPIQVAGEHSQSVKFTTSAKANGPVTVVAQLFTDDGQAYGPPVRFEVKVTEITPTVMLVIGGGVLLLVLAGFRMYTQRKRAAARQAAEEQENTPDTEGGAEALNGVNTDAEGTVDTTEDTERSKDGPDGESTTESGADDPEHPSDPTPDTAPESTDPSGTGERVDR